MRSAVITVTVLLLVAAVLLTLWSSRSAVEVDQTPPGQYPVDAVRFEWPATEHVAGYGPAKGMGSNKVRFAGGDDIKGHCATASECSV
jgi:hypothetical protein